MLSHLHIEYKRPEWPEVHGFTACASLMLGRATTAPFSLTRMALLGLNLNSDFLFRRSSIAGRTMGAPGHAGAGARPHFPHAIPAGPTGSPGPGATSCQCVCDAGDGPGLPSAPAVAASEAAAGRGIRLGPCTTRAHQGATALGRTDRQTGPPAVASRQLHCCREYLPIVTAGTELWSFAELTEWTAGLSTLSGRKCEMLSGTEGAVPDRESGRRFVPGRESGTSSRPHFMAHALPSKVPREAASSHGLKGWASFTGQSCTAESRALRRTSVVPQCFVFGAQS